MFGDLIPRTVPAELHQMLPWWVGYASLLTTTLLWFFATLLVCQIGALIVSAPLRSARDRPWHDQARHAHSVRMLLSVQALAWPLIVFILTSLWPLPLAFGSLAVRCFPPALAALAAALWVRYRGERMIFDNRYTVLQLMRSTIVYHFALGQFTIVLAVVAALMMPSRVNVTALGILAAMTAAVIFFTRGGSLHLLRAIGLLVPADDRLRRIVGQAAADVNFQPPKTYLARMPAANALAFPWNGCLAFSEGITEGLDDEQLKSIAAHEICHLGMPTSQKVMRLVTALTVLISIAAIKPIIGHAGPGGILPAAVGMIFVIVIVQLISRRIMHREEQRADRAGAAVDEALYAGALEQIYRQNLTPANWRSPQGHPALYDRMVASGVQPTYDKPKPPSPWLRHLAFGTEVMVFLSIVVALLVAHTICAATLPHTVEVRQAFLATAGGSRQGVNDLGELYVEAGEEEIGGALKEFANGS